MSINEYVTFLIYKRPGKTLLKNLRTEFKNSGFWQYFSFESYLKKSLKRILVVDKYPIITLVFLLSYEFINPFFFKYFLSLSLKILNNQSFSDIKQPKFFQGGSKGTLIRNRLIKLNTKSLTVNTK